MELGIFFDHLVEAARQKNLPLQRVLEHASAAQYPLCGY